MNNKTLAVIAALVVVGGAGAYLYFFQGQTPAMAPYGAMGTNGSANQGNMGGTDTGTPQQPQGDGTTVSQNLILGINADTKLGPYLSAFNGMTVYTFANDKAGVSNCIDACAAAWPPYTVKAASDIHVPATILGKVGTMTRADGTLQVTYNGAPLYFWASDLKPGDTMGNGIGKVWFVAKP